MVSEKAPARVKGRGLDEGAETPSRSAKKRASLALQRLGEKLLEMAPERRAGLHLPEDLAEALDAYARITTNEGKRRQRQYIGRLMRSLTPEEAAAIDAA